MYACLQARAGMDRKAEGERMIMQQNLYKLYHFGKKLKIYEIQN